MVESEASGDYPQPVDVTVPDEGDELRIAWSDGHIGIYPWDYLRGACPCATCKGNHLPMEVVKIFPIRGTQLIDYRPEGKYAFRLLFSDGHDTGIYNFRYLRKVCQCEECAQRRVEA